MGVPAVVAGALVVHGGGLVATAHEYAWFVTVTALAALALRLRPTRALAATSDSDSDSDARIRQICPEG